MADAFSIRIGNDLSELKRLNESVMRYLEPYEISPEGVHTTELALEEMITNIIKYGFDDPARHEIGVTVHVTESHVELRLEDDGHEFNPLEQGKPNLKNGLDHRPIGGLGIFLVRQTLDAMDYQRRDDRNILQMLVRRES
jgi:anti-sigma regulatory factor (Ser/Thr protein kinase)